MTLNERLSRLYRLGLITTNRYGEIKRLRLSAVLYVVEQLEKHAVAVGKLHANDIPKPTQQTLVLH